MRFTGTPIEQAFIVDIEAAPDSRGYFARTFCAAEFARQGLEAEFVQSSLCYNRAAGTLRGLHFQSQPHAESKLVSCLAGAVFDVIVDLRPHSPSRGQWFGVELTATSHRALYVPGDCAHGFMTLTDDAVVSYQMSEAFVPELARGLAWNDAALAIAWPRYPAVLSDRDMSLPSLAIVLEDVAEARQQAGLD
jgi:dTDP-4-dehydrorhamnose 3,5-epimerase